MDRRPSRQAGARPHPGAHRSPGDRQSGQHRVLGGGIGELKIDHGPGYRVYYHQRGTTVVILLCGGTKSTQRDDIHMAQALVAQLES